MERAGDALRKVAMGTMALQESLSRLPSQLVDSTRSEDPTSRLRLCEIEEIMKIALTTKAPTVWH